MPLGSIMNIQSRSLRLFLLREYKVVTYEHNRPKDNVRLAHYINERGKETYNKDDGNIKSYAC